MTFTAINNSVILDTTIRETVRASGLTVVRDDQREPPSEGVVVAMGCRPDIPEYNYNDVGFKVGDTVAFLIAEARNVVINGKLYTFSRFENIVALVKES